MKRAEIHAIYYNGNGFPTRRAWRVCWNDQTKQYNQRKHAEIAREVGFQLKTFSHDGLTNPSAPVDVTPDQDIEPVQGNDYKRLHDAVFMFGRAKITTQRILRSGHSFVEKVQDVDEFTPAKILNVRKTTGPDGKPEEYVLAEFTYNEVEDRDNRDHHEEAPAPSPVPSNRLSLVS